MANPTSIPSTKREPGKMTFICLLGLTALLMVLVLTIFYIVPYFGLSAMHPLLPILVGVFIGVVGTLALAALVLIVMITILGKDIHFSKRLRNVLVKLLLPVITLVGKLVGFCQEDVQQAFMAVNNGLIKAQWRRGSPPKKVLLLMPHCLQNKDCTVKITSHVENCRRCGQCPVDDLLSIAEEFSSDLAIASGGTIARRIVMEKRPDLIIAVACERDLTHGIQDTSPLPVYGVLNLRPFGPCLNTQVPLDQLRSILQEIATARAAEAIALQQPEWRL
jgi:uncharacterized protein